jgi:large subunit ribosomal protein L10
MPNQIKTDKVNNLKEKIKTAKSIIFAHYHGLDANKVNELRAKITETGGEMIVEKNTLMKVALKEEDQDGANAELTGPVATFFSYEDAISPIKVLAEFAKELQVPELIAGFVDGKLTSKDQLTVLSQLPSKKELLAKVVGSLNAPLSGFVNVLGGSQKKFVQVISAIADEKSKEVS